MGAPWVLCQRHNRRVSTPEPVTDNAPDLQLAALNNLGLMYANGIGLDVDYVEAYRWLSLANFRLSPWETERRDKAVKTRDKLLTIMPQSDVDRAKALVIAWERKWQK